MSERFGLLFSDGSLLVLPPDAELQDAVKEAEEHDLGEAIPRTRVVRVKLEYQVIIRQ